MPYNEKAAFGLFSAFAAVAIIIVFVCLQPNYELAWKGSAYTFYFYLLFLAATPAVSCYKEDCPDNVRTRALGAWIVISVISLHFAFIVNDIWNKTRYYHYTTDTVTKKKSSTGKLNWYYIPADIIMLVALIMACVWANLSYRVASEDDEDNRWAVKYSAIGLATVGNMFCVWGLYTTNKKPKIVVNSNSLL